MLERLWDSLSLAASIMACHAAIFILAERMWPMDRQKTLRKGIVLDLVYSFTGLFLGVVVSFTWIGTAVDALKSTSSIGPTLSALHRFVGGQSYVVTLLLALLVSDFFGYWKHRIMHTKVLWPFHAVHHCSEEVDFLSNERFHPLEALITDVMLFGPLVLLGIPLAVIGPAVAIRRTHSVWTHTNTRFSYGPLSRVFVSPTFHRWHHLSDVVHKNYGNIFSFFDWAFGTYYVHRDLEAPRRYGVDGFPKTFGGQLVQPFIDVFRMTRRESPPRTAE